MTVEQIKVNQRIITKLGNTGTIKIVGSVRCDVYWDRTQRIFSETINTLLDYCDIYIPDDLS